MKLIRKGKKTSQYEQYFLQLYTTYIIPQDLGFTPYTITYQIIDVTPDHVSFLLTFPHLGDTYRLDCKYLPCKHETTYKLQVQCGI